MAEASPRVIQETERWFVSRGIPHFIDRYNASQDVFTRAVPVLVLVFLFELGGALNLEWPWWANVFAAGGGLAVLLGAWAVHNLVRGRAALVRPRSVDVPDLAIFVLVPALLPLLFGGQLRSAAVTAGLNLALLLLVYLTTSYGLVPMGRWAAGRLTRQLGTVAGLLVRALPLLLLFVTFLFLNAEVWEVSADFTGPFLASTVGLFAVIGTLFLLTRLPREIGQLAQLDSWETVCRLVEGTPCEGVASPAEQGEVAPDLSRRQRGNVALVMLFTQGLQVLLVSVMLGAFYVLFGLLTITPDTIRSWTGGGVHELAVLHLWSREIPLTRELLQVTGFLAGFSGLYFSVYVVTDATYRKEFFEELAGEVRQALAVRAVYLAARQEIPEAGYS